jgi:hypothetical protein
MHSSRNAGEGSESRPKHVSLAQYVKTENEVKKLCEISRDSTKSHTTTLVKFRSAEDQKEVIYRTCYDLAFTKRTTNDRFWQSESRLSSN